MSKGYKYKSHYHTIIGWPIREAIENGNGNGSRNTGTGTNKTSKETPRARDAHVGDGAPFPIDAEY